MRFWKRFAAASAAATVATVLGLLLVLMPASGADEIDQEVPGPANGFTLFADDPLQSFQPAQATIRAVEVYLQAEDFEGTFDETDVIVEIWTNGFGALVGSATVPLPENFTGGWLLLNFAPSLNVVPDDTYLLDVYLDAVLPVEEDLGWAYQDTSSYGRGAGTIGGNPVDPDLDFLFRTYYNDPTPPVVDYTLNPASPGDGGWYNVVPVTLTWTVTDPDSDVTLIGCVDQTVVAESPMTTYDCTADSNGGTTVHPGVSFGVDLTKPVITLNTITTPNGNGWNNTDVTASFTCTDSGGSGVDGGATNLPNVTLTTEGANQSLSSTGTCVDNAGNVADHITVSGINIDKTAPTIVAAATTTPNGANNWYLNDVIVHFTCADNLSGFAVGACPGDQTLTTEGSAVSASQPTVTDLAGNISAPSNLVTVKIDKTAPTATLSVFSGTLGTNGWYRSTVVMRTTGTFGPSGIASCTADQNFASDTASTTVNGSCTDNAGRIANALPFNLKIDQTAPTVSAAATTAPNGAGWYNSDVTVHFTCADALSGIATCPADQLLNSEGPAISSTGMQATDLAGNTSLTSNTVTVKIDKTAPVVSLHPNPAAPNGNGWYKTDVTVDTQGVDGGSGLTDANCTPDQLIGETPAAGVDVVGSCTDLAGNVGNAGPLNIKVDKTAPTTTLNVAGTAGTNGWYKNDPVNTNATGVDGLSGIDSCVSSHPVINTNTAGTLVTGTCTDLAGNSSTDTEVIKLDTTAPTGALTVVLGTVGLNGWYRSPVLVAATGDDDVSGPVVCDPPLQNLGTETAGTILNATCTNQAGISAPATPLNVKIDFTGPTVTLTPSGTPGNNGWFTSAVTVDTSGVDALSGQSDANCTADQFFNANTASTVVAGSCTDNAGNTSSTNTVIRIDLTDPVPTMLVTSGTPGDNGWYTTDVTVNTTGTDDVSGPVVCTPPTETHSLETMSYIFESTCENQAGRTATDSIEVKIDKTPPEVELVFITGAPGVNGWSTENVALDAIVTEDMANPVVCTPNSIPAITVETTGQLVEVTCTNDAGLETTASVLIKLDKTPPEADILVVEGVEGDNGWYTTTVTAEAFGSDTISGPVVCVPQLQQQSDETTGVDLEAECTNQAGLMTPVLVNVKVDKTAPTNVELAVTAGTLGNNGWYTTDVTVETTSDAETISDPVVCTADQQQTVDTAGQEFNGSCTNDAGLTTDADPLVIKLDKTPPTLAPTVPAAIEQNAVASATPNAADAMSGVASQSCGALVTTTLGTFTVQCTATDNAGNTTTVDVQYTVLSTAADCGKILFGTTPPPGGGVGTFAFSCGSIAQLIAVTGCNQATMTIYYNKPGGGYAVYIPASQVAAVNAEFVTIFNGNPQIPVNTIFSVKCV
ncbi:MAG: hypothetical protein R3B59_08005 [Dehalococcoidia bacterium]